MVISADCDIANGRPNQQIVYLRVVQQFDYIDIFWSRKKMDGLRVKALLDATSNLNRIRRLIDSRVIDLSSLDVERWSQEETAEKIAQTIGVEDAVERRKLITNIERAQTAIKLSDVPTGGCCFSRLLECRGEDRQKVLAQATRDMRSLPDELFFITGITEPADCRGYYALLDQIGSLTISQISDSLADVRNGKAAAYRFGRLSPTFKYSVAQRFGFLFQRIGLPNDHGTRHSDALGRIN